ncbi:MAG: 5'-nucleotidase C-terminal domain-containing protein [Bacteroidetes bacterium]|nr:5'-nucleotidase C-terminal domain-containing protein [Bacteroidota bacterium]
MTEKRRDFLKKVGLLSVGASVGSALNANNTISDSRTESSIPAKAGKQTVNILQTTDVHCQVHPHDELFWENNESVFRKTGGYAELATWVKAERKKHPNTFLIDTGDMFQGSELSVKTTGEAIVPILNALEYDLYIPGNWEVIYYKAAMQRLMGSLNAPKICTNMYHDLGEGKKGELIFQPYHIWHVAGIKIGFLSYTDPLVPIRQSPNYSKGIIYTHPEENLAHYIDVLRNQEQCAMVILLSHLGLSQQIHLSNQEFCKGVDYIFGGDTHERVRKPIQGKYAKVVEPGAFGSFVGKLEVDVEEGKIVSERYSLEEIKSNELTADAEVKALIEKHETPFGNDIYNVVGYSTLPLYRYFVIENTIDTMILDGLKWRMPDIDVVLSNGFRFCPPRVTRDKTGNVPITEGYIFDMLPVDSLIRRGEVTGEQIMKWLEKELNNVFAVNASERFGGWVIKFQGMKVKFKAYAPKGERVQEVLIGKKKLDPEKVYSICACERDGDPEDMLCRMKNVKNTRNTEFTLHEMMKAYLKNNSPVTPKPHKNAVALDAPETLLTQVWGVDYEFR